MDNFLKSLSPVQVALAEGTAYSACGQGSQIVKFVFATLKEEQIDDKILLLNLTPRKVLGCLTPLKVLTGWSLALIA